MAKIIDGVEYLDDTPVVRRTRLKLPPNSILRMRAAIRQELSRQAESEGNETFEEADDFELPDSEEWVSPYEEVYEPPPSLVDSGREADKTPAPAAGEPDRSAEPESDEQAPQE